MQRLGASFEMLVLGWGFLLVSRSSTLANRKGPPFEVHVRQ